MRRKNKKRKRDQNNKAKRAGQLNKIEILKIRKISWSPDLKNGERS
jgi:hypothetical protein